MKYVFGRVLLEYLRFFTHIKLSRVKPKIIGVTGSMGKTSAMHALATIISPSFKTKITVKGNSESGIPLEILNIKLKDFSFNSWLQAFIQAPLKAFDDEKFDVLVVEMGIDEPIEPKNMGYLLKIVKPNIGIILNISSVHTQQFGGNLEAIAKEKGLLVTTMDTSGTAIHNSDDPLIAPLEKQTKATVETFGKGKNATVQIKEYIFHNWSTTFVFEYKEKQYKLNFPKQVFFEQYGYIFAASLLAGLQLGISIEEGILRLEQSYHLPPGRLSILKGEKQSMIIDSSYNASPSAVKAALQLLKLVKTKGKKIVVLGDMRELGVLAEEKHKEIAVYAGQSADIVIFVGPLMKQYALPELLRIGFSKDAVFQFDTAEHVGQFIIDTILKKDDVILVKGSQNTIFLETVVAVLMKEKTKAHDLLCRQLPYWQKVKRDFFRKGKL